ncbi:HNH endonuclease [Candidatus Kaiserbacteria bacterium]|nr:HNH endonuclease [Candidatus Kaiserbacteria bacterium]
MTAKNNTQNEASSVLLLGPKDYEFWSGRSFFEDFRDVMAEKRCAYCGTFRPDTRDHVIPKAQGGTDDPSNLVYSCRSCNSKKGSRTPEQANMPIVFVEESRIESRGRRA